MRFSNLTYRLADNESSSPNWLLANQLAMRIALCAMQQCGLVSEFGFERIKELSRGEK